MSQSSIAIVAAKRTPMGAFQGQFAALSAVDLGATILRALKDDLKDHGDKVTETYMGCVLSAGLGQAPARQSVLKAGLSPAVAATTVNKVCGSGLKAVTLAYDALCLGAGGVFLAGGMESMSRAPYLLTKGRGGYRMGHDQVFDHMMLDGLEDAYNPGTAMGVLADTLAATKGFSRERQDDFALSSAEKALHAQASGFFKGEIVPVDAPSGKERVCLLDDEPISRVRLDKIRTLRPAFTANGTVTAANASSISDGAAAVALTSLEEAEKHTLTPLAIIRGHSSFSQEPEWFTLAPIGAIQKVLDRVGWTIQDVDLFEINEAFAVVALAAIDALSIPIDKVNVHGGACALGHPIGASGARILVTLVHGLITHNKRKGVAVLCIGGGEAIAIAIERADR